MEAFAALMVNLRLRGMMKTTLSSRRAMRNKGTKKRPRTRSFCETMYRLRQGCVSQGTGGHAARLVCRRLRRRRSRYGGRRVVQEESRQHLSASTQWWKSAIERKQVKRPLLALASQHPATDDNGQSNFDRQAIFALMTNRNCCHCNRQHSGIILPLSSIRKSNCDHFV